MNEHIPTHIAVIGNPNSGKTTLFNKLTGRHQTVGNYPGVTVDKVVGRAKINDKLTVDLIDLPGIYSLDPISPDEQVARDVLFNKVEKMKQVEAIIIVADATSLQRSLNFIGDVIQTGVSLNLPSLLVVTMIDELKARGGALKVKNLEDALGIPVIGIVGNKGIGIDDLRAAIANENTWAQAPMPIPEDTVERFAWADKILENAIVPPKEKSKFTEAVDKVVLNPALGLIIFALVMFIFFQIIFVVASPIQDALEDGINSLGGNLRGFFPPLLESLLVDGIIAGVGGVLVFVPQIALLLLMIAILEGSGYLARSAFLIDRVMGWAGLEGRSFVALLSSYACAIPGIMATRSIPDPKSRLATILAAPFMTCSARLPVYALLIGAFVPKEMYLGFISLQGLVLFGLYLIGSISALLAGFIFKNGVLRGRTYPFYMELPPYRVPTLNNVFHRVWSGVYAFLHKAGTIILITMVVIWALLQFPQVDAPKTMTDSAEIKAYQVEHSAAAKIGHVMEPVIAPLGFDWKIGIGILASFSAREVIVGTLAQIYAFEGDEEDVAGLGKKLATARHPDGSTVYTLPTVFALLIFYVYAMQCISTLAIMRRETNSVKWPLVSFSYMTLLAWVGGFIAYHITEALM